MRDQPIQGFRLSVQQRRLWKAMRVCSSCCSRSVISINGLLDEGELKKTLERIVSRHEILRTTFCGRAGVRFPVQKVESVGRISWGIIDLEGLAPESRSAAVDDRFRADPKIDVETGPVLNASLLRLSGTAHVLFLELSTLCTDTQSLLNLFQEISNSYAYGGEASQLASELVQYVEVSEWQHELLTEEDADGRNFWSRRDHPTFHRTALPFEIEPREGALRVPRRKAMPVASDIAAGIGRVASSNSISEKDVLLAAWSILLWRYGGQSPMTIGVLVDGRLYEELRDVLGPLSKRLPVQINLDGSLSFENALKRIHESRLEAEQWQEYYAGDEDRTSAGPIDRPEIAFEYEQWMPTYRRNGVVFSLREQNTTADSRKLNLRCIQTNDCMKAELWYLSDHFEYEDVHRLAAQLAALLESAIESPRVTISDLGLLTDAERTQLLVEFNNTKVELAEVMSIHSLLEKQADSVPDRIALVFEEERLSYSELDGRAKRVADRLQGLKVEPEPLVAIAVPRSIEMILALFGVLKAGAAYVPLEVTLPTERLGSILEESGAAAVLTLAQHFEKVPGTVRKVCLDGDPEGVPIRTRGKLPQVTWPSNLAYVVFTSGSAGQPKGVAVEHRQLINYVNAIRERLRVDDEASFATVSTFGADLGNTSIFAALSGGGSLHVVSEDRILDPGAMVSYFEERHVDCLKIVPSHLQALQKAVRTEQLLPRRRLILGGEASPLEWIEALRPVQGKCTIFNHYGPTEATVGVLCHEVRRGNDYGRFSTLPIGCPLANCRVYVLNRDLAPVPTWLAGELYIAGNSLARGYLHRPEMTAERFIPDPFSAESGGRLYRTGDLVRHLPTRDVEFLGRVDFQVKIRGFRIELGEVESLLRRHPAVEEAVVLAREDEPGDLRLAAYIVPKRALLSTIDGRSRHRLPNGMWILHQNHNETDYLYNEIFVRLTYARHGIRLRENPVIIDVGANIGMFSLFASQHRPGAKIYSFEPVAPIFETLRVNTELYAPNARVFQIGLADREKFEEFTFYPHHTMMSGQRSYADPEYEAEVVKRSLANAQGLGDAASDVLHGFADELVEGRFEEQVELCRLRRLSDVIREQNIERIDLLKVDAQRAEMDVLRGLDEEEWEKVDQLVMEVHDVERQETEGRLGLIVSLLEARGFSAVVEQDELLKGTDRYALYATRRNREIEGDEIHKAPRPSAMEPVAREEMSAGLREWLREKLPEPMQPSHYVVLDELPLTKNGKVDRVALPEPDRARRDAERTFEAPRDQLEEVLAAIWSDVLGFEKVSVRENFFDLGGHSLLATQVISRVRDAFGVELPLRTLFDKPTVADLGRAMADAMSPGREKTVPSIERSARTSPLPLSFSQQRLWFLYHMDPESFAYHIPIALRLRGQIDRPALSAAFVEIVRRHEVLRTTFSEVEGQPVQVIASLGTLGLPVVDLASLAAERRESELLRVAQEEAERPFDLVRGPLLRANLVLLGKRDHGFLVTLHHIVSDAWSKGVMVRELGALYKAFSAGQASPLPDLEIQYADYAQWQRNWLSGSVLESELEYWRKQLGSDASSQPPALDLPTDRPRPALQTSAGAIRDFGLSGELSGRLRGFCRGRGMTPFMALLTTFQVLLGRYSGQTDIAVGTPIAGRTLLQTEGLIGFFLNMLVLRTDLGGDPSGPELLERVREVTLAAYAHQNLPFEMLVEELQPERNLAHSPFFQVMFILQNVRQEPLELPEVTLELQAVDHGTAKFDLTLTLMEAEGGLAGAWEYNRDLFDGTTIGRLGKHFEVLLAALVADPERHFTQLPLVTAGEHAQLLWEWNDGAWAELPERCVHALFEEQVERTPEAVALEHEAAVLSYRELDRRAARLARHLGRLGVAPEVRVGLSMERSLDMVVGLMGILKAGGVYVPLDPAYPRERLAFMALDAGLGTMLLGEDRHPWPGYEGAVVRPGALSADSAATAGEVAPGAVTARHLAYVIFTSGSTGRPKGVEISHWALANFLASMRRRPGLSRADTLLAVTTLSFDISGLELFLPLVEGARVVLAGRETAADGALLAACLEDCGATVMQATPATWQLLLASGWRGSRRLRALSGGEALPGELASALRGKVAALWNLYGPTETTIWSAVHAVDEGRGAVAIGRPIANTSIHLLDGRLEPAPAGVPGELHIGGAGLARGYLRRPAMTAESFIPDPFGVAPGGRLYRTGDLARHRPDGVIAYLGRRDHQVKVRGFRIELGEIESVLAGHPGVGAAVVVAREDLAGGRGLVAWVVNRKGANVDAAELRHFVRESLPDYMTPSFFVFLDELPLTPAGKVDRTALGRRALPRTEPTLGEEGTTLPRTPAEELLAGAFCEVLGIEQVSVEADFFALGGHSLLAMQLLSRLRETFAVELAVRAVFEAPTAAGLAARVERAMQLGEEEMALPPAIEPAPRDGLLPLSFAQQRLWFLHQMVPESVAYNIPLSVRLVGPLDVASLTAGLSEIVRRHETLRTTFHSAEGEPVQKIGPSRPFALPAIDLKSLPAEERTGEAARLTREESSRPFDLCAGPLLRGRLLVLGDEEHAVLLVVHHIVSDLWSMWVLAREMGVLYRAFAEGRPSPLPELEAQYADFALWQRRWLSGEILERKLGYWKGRLSDMPPALELPVDRPRPALQTFRGASHRFGLPAALLEALRTLSLGRRSTLFMTLLAAFQSLLSRLTAQFDISVGVAIAGRNHVQTEPLIGFFINTLVLRTDLGRDPRFLEILNRVKEVALEAYAHQDLPFEKLVEELRPERSLSHSPLFQVALTLQNVPYEPLRLAGLTFEPLEAETGAAKFDLALALTEAVRGLMGSLVYNEDLFDRSTVGRMAGHFAVLLSGIAGAPERRLSELELLTEGERSQLLREWNDTAKPCPQIPLVHELFAACARTRPDAIAVVSTGGRLTYGRLEARANRLAHHLRSLGVGPEARVAMLTERTLERSIGIVAILKAGGAYVSLDPAYPKERLAFLLEDVHASLVLTQQTILRNLALSQGTVICLDTDWPSISSTASRRPPAGRVGPQNLAYVVYTSGSTGRPKGVEIPHQGLMNLVRWHRDLYRVTASDRGTQVASPAFDASIWEFWPYLSAGASSHIPDEEIRLSPAGMVRWWSEQRITLAYLPTPLAEAVLKETIRPELNPELRALIIGGDRLHRGPDPAVGFRLMNHYGPAEYSIVTTVTEVPPEGQQERLPTIGRAIDNTRMYVLDRRGQQVATRLEGELFIGGVGLARGYLRRAGLTAEKFAPDPFSSEPGERLYATGDRVRYLPDGDLDFLGRFDHQVKLRGLRIELGEIEAVLNQHPEIREVAVLILETRPGDKRLCAYMAPRSHQKPPSVEELKVFLRELLPEYMVPRVFLFLETLPLTPNGKIDRKRLPEPDWAPEAGYIEPKTPLEGRLAAVWAEVLGLDQVGVHDNFFDLGGHSLLMVRLQDRLRETLGLEISLVELFRQSTVRALADHLGGHLKDLESDQKMPMVATRSAQRSLDRERGEIAIIGMSGRFPKARSVKEFWRNLCLGVEGITTFTEEELLAAGIRPDLLNHPKYVKAVGALSDAGLFDADFFGYSPREALTTDPQHRLFLECAWEALEDAGYGAQEGRGAVGVFAGTSISSYLFNLYSNPDVVASISNQQLMISNDKDHLPTRVSYKLNLRGPSFTVQTACSTSLVAVHVACQSLLNGECDMALAGGASVNGQEKRGYLYQEGGIQSPDGHCRAFDAAARGTVIGDGVGVVVLKRLEEAQTAGDPIYAVIRGTSINNDGSGKVGYTAPSVDGQAAVIAEAQEMAGVDPTSIGYVEAHGTGTRLGDPIEIAALTQVFQRRSKRAGYCAIGSVKTNIGHLSAAAGVAGLIKTALAVHDGRVPPSLHFERPNPEIDFSSSPFYVSTATAPWPIAEGPRRAGVSSFGIGGTNVHVVLEEPPPPLPGDQSHPHRLLLFSARSENALENLGRELAADLRCRPQSELDDFAHTLQVGRERFPHRRALVCRDGDDAISAFEDQRWLSRADATTRRPVAFLFPGQGAQYAGMGRALYERKAVYRESVDECADLLEPHLGYDLRTVLHPVETEREGAAERLRQTATAQPALFVVEYALARLWMSWGVEPRAMLGHSIGEYVAATLAGVFSKEDALALVAARGRLMQSLPQGAMLAVPLSPELVGELLGKELSLAAVNAPELCVASGPAAAIERLMARLQAEGHDCRGLHTSHAFHSSMMEPIVHELEDRVAAVARSKPRIPFVSNLTGKWIEEAEATDPRYWARQLRETVRFMEGVERIVELADTALLELGPGTTLATFTRRSSPEAVVVSSLPGPTEDAEDEETALGALGRLWLAGVEVDWKGFHAGAKRRRLHLPTYPFERRNYWLDPSGPDSVAMPSSTRLPLEDWTHVPVWQQSPVYLLDAFDGGDLRLLFVDPDGPGEPLADRLRSEGGRVLTVESGERFERRSRDSFSVNPTAAADYLSLLETLVEEGGIPRTLVHLWTLSAPGSAGEERVRGFQSLFSLAQALARLTDGAADVELIVVSNRLHGILGDEVLEAEKATVLGPVKVIPQELYHLHCRCVDIGEVDGTKLSRQQVDLLRLEMAYRSDKEVVAYRGACRFRRNFEPARLAPGPSPWRTGGAYLITGGLGRLGLVTARHLAERGAGKLALLSRGGLPPREEWEAAAEDEEDPRTARGIRAVRELEELGAEVLVLSADATVPEALARALDQVDARFGKLDGAIHAAGVFGIELIQQKSAQEAERILAPKVEGGRALSNLLKTRDVDFLVLFSSLSSVAGGIGMVDYSAGNAFLDALAWHNNSSGGPRTFAIDWAGWRDAESAAQSGPADEDRQRFRIRDGEGMEILDRVLAGRMPQVVVTPRALDEYLTAVERLRRVEEERAERRSSTLEPRPPLETPYIAPRDELEETLADIWQELLGIEQIGVRDNFFELGGHSLLATQVSSRLRDQLGVEVPLDRMLAGPTIEQLAVVIDQEQAQEIDETSLEELLSSIEGLSEDETSAALASLPTSSDPQASRDR